VWTHFVYPLYSGRPSGIFRPAYPAPPPVLSPATILEATKAMNPTVTMVIPSILEAWSRDPEAVAYLATLQEIVSPLPRLCVLA
jgi:hypothetical protein